MNKTASIKIGFRKALEPFSEQSCTLARPDTHIAEAQFGDVSFQLVMSEFNDSGDVATETEHDDIFNALQAVADEHNAAIP